LFDDCSHEYTQQQNAQAEKQQARKQRWERLEQLAAARKTAAPSTTPPAPKPATPADEAIDPSENQRRMEALRLQDDPHRSSASVSTHDPQTNES
jgi:serine/threonine-protein phosphatase 2A regulatory subunit B'